MDFGCGFLLSHKSISITKKMTRIYIHDDFETGRRLKQSRVRKRKSGKEKTHTAPFSIVHHLTSSTIQSTSTLHTKHTKNIVPMMNKVDLILLEGSPWTNCADPVKDAQGQKWNVDRKFIDRVPPPAIFMDILILSTLFRPIHPVPGRKSSSFQQNSRISPTISCFIKK